MTSPRSDSTRPERTAPLSAQPLADEPLSAQPLASQPLSDDELVIRARSGDAAAYGELWSRHSGIGLAVARRYFDVADPDDIVAESFARILATIKRGGGPRAGFRPYLITTIGNVARRWATRSKEGASDELDLLEDPSTLSDPVVASTDREFALEAFKSLPERWQAVLWYSAVEGMGPSEIAGYLGMTPNATAVLAHRARAGLRTAWVQAHLNDASLPAECRWTAGRLGRRATGSLLQREQERVRAHLATCLGCRARARELDQVSARLAVILVPALLGLTLPLTDEQLAAAAVPLSVPMPTAAGVTSNVASPWAAPSWVVSSLATGAAASLVAALLLSANTMASLSDDAARAWLAAGVASASASDPRDRPADGDGETSDPGSAEPASPGPEPLASAEPTTESAPPPSKRDEPIVTAAAPAAPVVTSSIDPLSPVPPTLLGTGQPGARLLVTDETGASITEVVVDATGTWSTGPLTALSPAASGLQLSLRDADGRRSPSVAVPLATRPLSAATIAPLAPDWRLSGAGFTPVTLTLQGWPGATITIDHVTSGDPREPRLPSSVTLDGSGRASLTVAEPWPGTKTVTVRYVDAVRTASSSTVVSFWVPWFPD